MLEAAGGGTDWSGMSMEQIQQLAQSPDIDLHYQIVDGWQKSYDLVGDHLAQVTLYRDSLATAWPPEKSDAARAYLDRLDTLIGHLRETQDAALANHGAMSSASLSLSLAKTKMNDLYRQWDANNKVLAAFNQQQAQKTAQVSTGKPMPSPSPSGPSPSPSGEEPPPVTADQQVELWQKAVTLMSGVSSDLAQAQLKVVRPALFDPTDFASGHMDSGGAPTNNPPVLPPIVPSFAPSTVNSGSGSSSSTRGKVTFPITSGNSPTATRPSSPDGPVGNQPGLVLGGTNPPTALPSPPTTIPTPPPLPTGSGSIINPGTLPPAPGTFLPNGTQPTSGGKFPPGEDNSVRPFGRGVPEGGLKAMPPGGIIGEAPDGAALGSPTETRFGTQRVNPVGGMIGAPGVGMGAMGGGRGVAPGVRGGTATGRGRVTAASQQPLQQVGRRASRRDPYEDLRWDPENPWVTAEGVDPVVLPSIEHRIDPGPAIGLD